MADTLNVFDNSESRTPVVIVFKERAGKPGGGGKGLLASKDISFTLSTLRDESICYEVYDARGNSVVGGVVRH